MKSKFSVSINFLESEKGLTGYFLSFFGKSKELSKAEILQVIGLVEALKSENSEIVAKNH